MLRPACWAKPNQTPSSRKAAHVKGSASLAKSIQARSWLALRHFAWERELQCSTCFLYIDPCASAPRMGLSKALMIPSKGIPVARRSNLSCLSWCQARPAGATMLQRLLEGHRFDQLGRALPPLPRLDFVTKACWDWDKKGYPGHLLVHGRVMGSG